MKQYAQQLLRYPDMGISLDFSKLPLTPEFLAEMNPLIERAYSDIAALEAGTIANPDENRMVGHYWLRNSAIAPTAELKAKSKRTWTVGIAAVLVVCLLIVVLVKELLRAPIDALFGGHMIARAIRYMVLVLFAGILWPMTFPWLRKLERKNEA